MIMFLTFTLSVESADIPVPPKNPKKIETQEIKKS